MGDLVRFVDTISSSPTLRLDLNDESTFWVKKFDAPPPRLRRSVAENSMRDGGSVGSAAYGLRTLVIELECRKSTQDLAATEIQKLWRELDRSLNWIQYQPTGATKPVFFRTFRSDASQLEDVMAQAAMRTFTIEVLAEPFALGLRETLGPYTIANDPAAASNPGYVDISGVLGDVPTEAIYYNTTYNRAATLMGVRHGDFSDIRPWVQCESMTLGTNTTNPGGGPDAAMSGTGTNNYVRTSFGTATMAVRLAGNVITTTTVQSGSWVVYGVVRRSDATSVMRVGLSQTLSASAPTETTTLPLSTARQMVRLGKVVTAGSANYIARVLASPNFQVWAARDSGAGTLDWDCLFFLPSDSAMLEGLSHSTTGSSSGDNVFDGVADRTMSILGGSPITLATEEGPIQSSGRIPPLVPNVTNRLHYLTSSQYDTTGLRVHAKSETNDVTVYYWPRYMHVRPVST
jgi:hypothetical protein